MFWCLKPKLAKSLQRFWLLAGLLALLPFGAWTQAQAAVTLVSFTATANMEFETIVLAWETASELDSAGFYLQRSTNAETGYARLDLEDDDEVDFFAASGGSSGAVYEFEDLTAALGVLYYYKLEEVSTTSQSTLYGPALAILGTIPTSSLTPAVTPTATATQASGPTATQTQTPTLTQTPTATQIGAPTATPTHTPTRTQTPTATQIGATAQPTASPTRAPTQTQSPTVAATADASPTLPPGVETTATLVPSPTTTLEPLPPIALLFPAMVEGTPAAAPAITVIAVTQVSSQVLAETNQQISGRLRLTGAVVVLLWLALGALVVIFFRKVNQ